MFQLNFTKESTPIELALTGNHSLPLVALSVLIAILAAFASVSHVDLMRATKSQSVAHRWHLTGALAMGIGVWTMHFVGMVAFQLPMDVYFEPLKTSISVIPAIFAGYIGLSVLRNIKPSGFAIVCGGTLMGVGIGVMHYIGMGGMLVSAEMAYRPELFALSILSAAVMASLALAVPRLLMVLQYKFDIRNFPSLLKLATASLMGLAISSLHYVAMSATVFLPLDGAIAPKPSHIIDETLIAALAVIASISILVVSTITVILRFRILTSDSLAEKSERQARQMEDRFQRLVSRLPGTVYQFQLDPDGRMHIPYASDAIESVHGVTADEVKHNADRIFQLVHRDDLEKLTLSIQQSAQTLSVWKHEYRICLNEGEHWLQGNAIPERLEDGSVLWNGFITDVTEKKQAEARINQLAFYDDLTGLPNRRLFEDRLGFALATASRHQQYGALLYLDLDDFKSLNDTLGHSFGDKLLRSLADILSRNFRETDTVARLGGDEFVIIAGNLGGSEEIATQNANRLAQNLLTLLNKPVDLNGYEYKCETSIGIALFDGAEQSREELLKRADTAMYEAKSVGRNVIRFHDPHIQSILAKRFRLEIELRQAMERNELTLAYQKQIGRNGRCEGLEALLRWKHPQQGFISPANFIPIAEYNGLIIPLGQWVLKNACSQLSVWQQEPKTRDLHVSVNVSSKQFHQPDFVEIVMRTLEQAGATADGLCLEVTESIVLDDLEDALVKMQALKAHGIRIAMDDFGTGYSSMAYLSRLPFDEVKIDKSFVQQADEQTNGNEWVIIETIITMARKLGMRVVAEGVETSRQHELLDKLGCDCFQGFYFSHPVDLQTLSRSLLEEEPVI
ncbi:EAL domain-containing protein [Marinobacter sediminum]|uniref:EAL domain-containing protein n=1 Tax=Marinobacter sediminum TaxID=256323 RepID=UPI0019393878|nr:EAL domain-containing protein [Marinobacter sediminum]